MLFLFFIASYLNDIDHVVEFFSYFLIFQVAFESCRAAGTQRSRFPLCVGVGRIAPLRARLDRQARTRLLFQIEFCHHHKQYRLLSFFVVHEISISADNTARVISNIFFIFFLCQIANH